MPSFISNFNALHRQWILQVFISFCICMLIANAGVRYLQKHTWWAKRDLQMGGFQNEAIAEQYTYGKQKKDIVIVGSSVSTQLPPEGVRPRHVGTIFIQGSGGMSGLELLVRSGAAPKLVLVEIDFLARGVDIALIDTIYTANLIKKYIPALRYENNLVNLFSKRYIKTVSLKPLPQALMDKVNLQLAPRIDAELKAAAGVALPESDIQLLLNMIEARTRILSQRGCKIVFFALPKHPKKVDLPGDLRWKQKLSERFPHYPIIEPNPNTSYFLVDGLHFCAASGKAYFDYLMQEIKRLGL